jgi:exopolysaccharide biosynthesis polyprenyl glycosylphosphotransferase
MLRRNWRMIFVMLSIIVDLIAIAMTGVSAYYLRNLMTDSPRFETIYFFYFVSFFGSILLFVGLILGVYRATFHSQIQRQYLLAGKAYVFSMLIILSVLYAFRSYNFPPRFTFIFLALVPFFFALGRSVINQFNMFLQRRGLGIYNVLLVGYDNGGIKIFDRLKSFPELGYNIKGIISKDKPKRKHSTQLYGVDVPLFKLTDLERKINDLNIDRIFVPSAAAITNGYAEAIKVSKRQNIKLNILSPESDQLLRLASVYDIAGITVYAPPRFRIEAIKYFFKRSFDIISASFILIVVLPIILITAVSIMIESGFPVFFKQRRTAVRGGKEFDFIKFRSMIKNADQMKESLFAENETDGILFKMKNDPRMTRVGQFIRRYSIDELPQLINVIKGEMSLVGPRPLPIADFDKADERSEYWEYVKARDKVKPGITGLWQISGRSNLGFKEMVWLDLYYVENQSLLFDLEILFETIPVVLFGKGAY